MNKFLTFIKKYRMPIYVAILLLCLASGLAFTLITFRENLGMGDNSTFYAFARNIVHGEVVYKDFIHFRTPGTILMFAGLMKILGQHQSTIEFGTRFETLVLYPFFFLLAGAIALRTRKNPLYILAAFVGIAFLPGVAQLRAAFGLLAIAVYITSLEVKKYQMRYLFLAGVLTGVTFFFGQEIALMVAVCLFANEVVGSKWDKTLLERAKILLLGVAAGLLPLVLYIALFSSVRNFLYYTLYYSFVQQPKFMNLPYPNFGYTSLLYFLPFFMYVVCFLILYANKNFGKKEALLLSFASLRLITAMGRSDFGHFIFSIPEVFLIVPYFLVNAKDVVIDTSVMKKFAPYGIGMALLFELGIRVNSIALVFIPFVILYALYRREKTPTGKVSTYGPIYTTLSLGICFALFIYALMPTYIAILKDAKKDYFANNSHALYIGGVMTDPINYQEIKEVEAAALPLHPQTVFSYPIQPFYYELAPHHASRFLTYEAETTVAEQQLTIQDLERTKPQVVLMDPLQAQGLSGSLWQINNYITSHYQLIKEVSHRDILWVMVPKATPARDDELAMQLLHDNPVKTDATAVQDSQAGLNDAIVQNASTLKFYTTDTTDDSLVLSVAAHPGMADCGTVIIKEQNKADQTTVVCTKDGQVSIPIKASSSKVEIVLQKTSGAPVLWNQPHVVD